MNLQFPPITFLYFVTAMVLWYVAFKSWQLRATQGAKLWSRTMLALGFMAFMDAVALTQASYSWRILVEYIVLSTGGVVVYYWGLFMLRYSQFDQWYTARNIRLFAVVPIVFAVLVFTSQWHELVYKSHDVITNNNISYFEYEYNWGFWVWLTYDYVIILGGLGLLIFSVFKYPRVYQGQAVILVIGSLIPLVFVAVNLAFHPIGDYDITSVGFAMTGIAVYIGMRRFKFLNFVPVAYDLVFKSSQNGVIVIDGQNIIVDLNPSALQILDKKLHKLVGHQFDSAFQEWDTLIQAVLAEDNAEIIINNRDYKVQNMPLMSRRGYSRGKLIILHDITKQKQYLEELNAYAHTVAHDLKNPLGIVFTFTEILRSGKFGEFSPDVEEILSIIDDSSRKMRSIIDNLLMLATVRNTEEIDLQPLDMSEIVAEVLKRLDQSIKTENAEIKTAQTWPISQGYAPWIEEVWINYVTNALKYGGEPPIIELGSHKLDNGFVRYWIKDNGPGLSPEEQAVLFAKHTRLEQHANLAGHGLGLSIVQRIIHKLNGQVGVESTLGNGSLFYFTLPEAKQTSILPFPHP